MLDVLIIGAGPAGLFAAERLSARGLSVTVADRMPSPARKFLMAGRGGLNLTHSENSTRFLSRYRDGEAFLAPMIEAFPPDALRDWCESLGQETFVGSSGRVFPRTMKASPLLRAWLHRLDAQGVRLLTRTELTGFQSDGSAQLADAGGAPRVLPARAVLLALGGASWPRLGSSAAWVPALAAHGVTVVPFRPANCGFRIAWSPYFSERFAGTPLKRIALGHGARTVAGEAVISQGGLEGGAVYALSAELRDTIRREGAAGLTVDLRPAESLVDVHRKLSRPRGKQSMATFLRKVLRLKPEELALLREPGALPQDAEQLARRVKALPLTCSAPYDIDRAISSAGGIALDELNENLMLRRLPGVFAAGEMLDWEAPTGGYLLQACFATAARAADGILDHLAREGDRS